ncbi:hypothetical protein ABT299_02610 [Spirillospora sp. NPDC000708]
MARRVDHAGFGFRAVAADSAYGDQDNFRGELRRAGLPFVMALKPRHGVWAYGSDAYIPADAARILDWGGPERRGDWLPIDRRFRDGHTEQWWAAEATLGWWGPDGHTRLVVATADRAPCRPRPPGTWPPTCPATAGPTTPHAAATAHTLPPTWPNSSGSTASATGSSSPTNRSRTNSDGPTSRSAPTPRSAATRSWSTARAASAGTPGSPIRDTLRPHPDQPPPPLQRGGPTPGPQQTRPFSDTSLAPNCPHTLRAVRSWLIPAITLTRWWKAWSNTPPPTELQELIDKVSAGHGLHLIHPTLIQQTTASYQ